jgi:hypothetical protein
VLYFRTGLIDGYLTFEVWIRWTSYRTKREVRLLTNLTRITVPAADN